MLTVITKPISPVYSLLKKGQKLYYKTTGRPLNDKKYGGHYAVTRSIVEGLTKIGADFNYNPSSMREVADTVYVPGGYQALKWAIKMKREGKIKRLIAGPNLVVIPHEKDGIIKSKEIDLFLTNSEWVRDFYIAMAPELKGRIGIWPAGVDTEFWRPQKQPNIEKKVLLYHKRPIQKLFDQCVKFLQEKGYQTEILYYGKYTIDQYRECLNRNSLLIHFVEQESQGLSLAEAWSMDTPTIVWDPGYYHFENGENHASSAAPYLTQATGLFFRDMADFEKVMETKVAESHFSPRQWAVENMSDEACARKLLEIINSK